ncbi:MAG TPA: carbohydrate kinase [Candidatus Blautia avistercoris]|nr:carbohydrate kinase [Candidatus Blautia avistercoris]
MKKVLVIGSAVADVVINLENRLPRTGEDVHVIKQQLSLGGCAYNVSDSIRHFQAPYLLFSPVGTGVYGNFVREELRKRQIVSPIPTPQQENGCCYCFVETTGERTFVCYHGAEYLFRKEWFSLLDLSQIDSVYLCGLEIEEVTGDVIIDFLCENPQLTVYFAPGPRFTKIEPHKIQRLLSLSPILHLNRREAEEASGMEHVEEAARWLYEKTSNLVVITLGEKGCYYFDGQKEAYIPSIRARQADTIGAGDAHIGSLIACLKQGDDLETALGKANRVSSAVVETEGALLSDEAFGKLFPQN